MTCWQRCVLDNTMELSLKTYFWYNQTHFYNSSGIFSQGSLKLNDNAVFDEVVISNTNGKLRLVSYLVITKIRNYVLSSISFIKTWMADSIVFVGRWMMPNTMQVCFLLQWLFWGEIFSMLFWKFLCHTNSICNLIFKLCNIDDNKILSFRKKFIQRNIQCKQ